MGWLRGSAGGALSRPGALGVARGGGVVLGTRDGGQSWEVELREADNRDSVVAPLPLVDAQYGWAVAPEAVWRTVDGGSSWTRSSL